MGYDGKPNTYDEYIQDAWKQYDTRSHKYDGYSLAYIDAEISNARRIMHGIERELLVKILGMLRKRKVHPSDTIQYLHQLQPPKERG